jgi:dTDP-4-amino-4,6-dideoxygalactose transaminase
MTVFSLHPVKTLTMGEGGVVTTNDPALVNRLRRLRNHGVVRDASGFRNDALAFDADGAPNPWYMEFQDLGFNYRASDMQCALGLSQLAKLDRFVTARRGLAGCYRDRLPGLSPFVTAVKRAPNCRPAWHLAVAMIDFEAAGVSRGELMRRLAARGIGSQVHYVPLHLQPCYRQPHGDLSLPGAERYYARCRRLPLFPTMSTCDVERVIDGLSTGMRADPSA